ncbi:MAG: hypothetical protein CBC48_10075 [bacterium TMED88]|nr:hypothetical protein [Deltaproteobacteria bacterium]OUV30924.1 MAG: hypothetical protein CBC48_10075 [bacterium TMED88]
MFSEFGSRFVKAGPSGTLVALLALLMGTLVGCHNWSEFGEGPTNPHRSSARGPSGGLTSSQWLHPFGTSSTTHGAEIGLLTDGSGDYYATSYNSELHVYNSSGNFQNAVTLPSGAGPRAVPYVVDDFPNRKAFVFTGSEGGGFHVIEVDKSTAPYTVSVAASITSVGVSESSPKRSQAGDFYLAEQWGDVHQFHYDFATATLTQLATYSLGERVAGAIAIYDAVGSSSGEEILVATQDGGFHVLDESLTGIIWSETTGYGSSGAAHDEYYGGVTVAERGAADPIALLPLSGQIDRPISANTGMLRAINLTSRSIEWEMTPSHTTLGVDQIPGSVSLMHPFWLIRPRAFQVFQGDTEQDIYADSLVVAFEPEGCEGCPENFTIETVSEPVWPDGSSAQSILPNFLTAMRYFATFASSDGYLYGVNLKTGTETWAYPLSTQGVDTPVTDEANFVYVADGASILHAVAGKTGAGIWTDSMIAISATSTATIVKLGISHGKELVVGSGVSAYILK